MLKKVWNDPVWSKVLAAGIVAVLGLAATFLLNLWHYLATLLNFTAEIGLSIWEWCNEPSQISNWLFVITGLLAIPTIFQFFSKLIGTNLAATKPEQTWRDYTQDEFYNVRFRWNYSNNQIINLQPFCSKCDFSLVPKFDPEYDKVTMDCENCNSLLQIFDGTRKEVENKILRHIDHKVRTGGWREVIEKQQVGA